MGFQLKRIGHIGIHVSDFERSLRFYTEVVCCKLTAREIGPHGREIAFLRFGDVHHDFVLTAAPSNIDVTQGEPEGRLIQQIAFEVEDRHEWLKAMGHLHAKGVKITRGPVIHGIEGIRNLGGSGSRSFYFSDPDGNHLEIFTDMMRVRTEGEFPPEEYADAMRALLES